MVGPSTLGPHAGRGAFYSPNASKPINKGTILAQTARGGRFLQPSAVPHGCFLWLPNDALNVKRANVFVRAAKDWWQLCAGRLINPGDELFYAYGIDYWLPDLQDARPLKMRDDAQYNLLETVAATWALESGCPQPLLHVEDMRLLQVKSKKTS
jgi:hypothetical protein